MSTTTIDNTEIKYDRITRDYAVLVDGVAVAYGRNYSDAESKRTAYLADRGAECMAATAAELDGAGAPGTCETCEGEGRLPAYGYGDQAGGYAETCPDCSGKGSTQIPSWLADAQAKTAACSEAHPCDNINHNHTGYRTPDTDSPEYRLRINRIILLTTKALHIPCRSCQADHLTQDCPQIHTLLFAEPVVMVVDVDFAPFGFAA
jgi:hypothetical protein